MNSNNCLAAIARVLILMGAAMILSSCGTTENTSMDTNQSFRIAIMAESVGSQPPGLGYTVTSSWPILQQAYPSQVVYNITENDIAVYDWSHQIVTLTPQASTALIEAVVCPDEQRTDLIFLCFASRAFVVSFDEKPLYGGVFLYPESAMGIDFPVIYVSCVGDAVVLTIRPIHVLAGGSIDNSSWRVIKDDRIEQLFAELDKFVK